MKISFSREQVMQYADLYEGDRDDIIAARIKQSADENGYITRKDLLALVKWKWPFLGPRQLVRQNKKSEVIEISAVAFAARSERLRIGSLRVLQGVDWALASTVLHFAFPDRYPILDARIMRAIGGSTTYSFESWVAYTKLCRDVAKKCNVSMRLLDKALWGFDKYQIR